MCKLKLFCFLCVIAVFLIPVLEVSAGTIQLPQTGQTKCYDTAGTEIDCAGTGQDGDIRAGVAWPNPRFADNGNETVTDNLTGLIWTKDANLMTTRDPSFATQYYPGAVTWEYALIYVKKLNDENYLGYNDWHLPNVNELESLTNADEPDSATWLNTQDFTNVQAMHYWTSSTDVSHTSDAWMWDDDVFRNGKGYDFNYGFFNASYVWPVCAGQTGTIQLPKTGQTTCYNSPGGIIEGVTYVIPCATTGQDGEIQAGVAWPSPRFSDNGNETVTDNLTGLMWTKNVNSPGPSACNPGTYKTWQGALDYVKCLNNNNYLGHSDWRLPNRKELRSLIDYSKYNPALPTGHPFPNVAFYLDWSSSTIASNKSYAWFVNMWNGDTFYGHKEDGYSVWPVRSYDIPTAVTLSSFTAASNNGKVVLKWETATEIDNIGFNILRSESENGLYMKINKKLIPAKGSATGGAGYKFVDEKIKSGKTYYYKLEDIDRNGTSKLHGPKSVKVSFKKKGNR